MPRSVQVYAWGLGIAGFVMLPFYLPALPLVQLLPTVGLAVCAIAFERYTMILPNRLSFSLGSTFVFLAYASLGVAPAFLVETAAAITSARRSRRTVQQVFNFGQLLVSLFVLHLTVSSLGQGAGELTVAGAAALLVGGVAFFLTNLGLITVVMRLVSGRHLLEIIADLARESYLGILGSLGMFIPLLYTFRQGGWITLLLFCAALLAFRYAVNLYLQQKRAHLDSLSQLSGVLERKIGAAESHAVRVAVLARTMAEGLKLPADEVDMIYAAGILHDVGEAEVDLRVVSVMARKAIPTLADLEAYRKHPALGADLVARMEGMAAAATLIHQHHEAWDGSGYPDGLRGDAIPLGARILAAAEALSEVSGGLEDQLAAARDLAGTVIDPGLVPVLEAALRKNDRPAAKAAAIMGDAGVSMLQGKLMETVRSSQLLETMGVGRILSYEHGAFTNFLGVDVLPPARDEVASLAEQCLRSQVPVRNHAVDNGTIFDVYCIPAGETVASLLLFDVTQALEVEREQTRRIFRAYRDVISVATGGRLLLIDEDELNRITSEGMNQGELALESVADGESARALVEDVVRGCGLDRSEAFRIKVCASEAITNVFKHAGKGGLSIRYGEGFLRIIVSDHGGGIPFEILPQAVLMAGYSTKKSLGKGFSVMLQYLDRVSLYTSGEGTAMILEKQLTPAGQADVTHRRAGAC